MGRFDEVSLEPNANASLVFALSVAGSRLSCVFSLYIFPNTLDKVFGNLHACQSGSNVYEKTHILSQVKVQTYPSTMHVH